MSKILICGAHSFVGHGFNKLAKLNGFDVDLFSRGICNQRIDNQITGDYLKIDENTHLSHSYDYVVNFAVLKDASIQENIDYLNALVKLCSERNVKKLIHFSSIMVYSRKHKVIDEATPIEESANSLMKGYGLIKISTDQFLNSVRKNLPFELVLVRPGFVLTDGIACPFIKHLFGNVHLILGNKKSTMPIVLREDIHNALIKILRTDNNLQVYHFFSDCCLTKFQYAKQYISGRIICLPKSIFKRVPFILAKLHIIPWSLYSRFEGMYNTAVYRSASTEKKLEISFHTQI